MKKLRNRIEAQKVTAESGHVTFIQVCSKVLLLEDAAIFLSTELMKKQINALLKLSNNTFILI